MTIKKTRIAPRYLSFYIGGSLEVDVPVRHGEAGIFSTDECIVVPCLYWNEGDTTITLGPSEELKESSGPPQFDGMLETPLQSILLFDADIPEILSMDASYGHTRVRIWTNHPTDPDDVVIVLG